MTMMLGNGVPELCVGRNTPARKKVPSCVLSPTASFIEYRYNDVTTTRLADRDPNVLRTPQEKPRPSARSLQGDRGTASDRLDHLNEPQGLDQSGALLVFQRLVGRAAAGDVLLR